MYYLIYETYPNDDNPEKEQYGGAHVGCWINVKNEKTARLAAEKMIHEHGWTIEKLVEAYPLVLEEVQTPKGREYFEQALIDNEVLVFYTSPRRPKRSKKNR